jgi:hypothetical protein
MLIRAARRTGQSQNHLFKLVYRGYTGMLDSGEGDRGVAACRYEFCSKCIADPEGTQEMVESFTRTSVGTRLPLREFQTKWRPIADRYGDGRVDVSCAAAVAFNAACP